jgi:cysteine synthase
VAAAQQQQQQHQQQPSSSLHAVRFHCRNGGSDAHRQVATGDRYRNVYVKLEYFNPLGSVKDRLAVGIMDWAEQNNLVQPGQTVVEASSGNTVSSRS